MHFSSRSRTSIACAPSPMICWFRSLLHWRRESRNSMRIWKRDADLGKEQEPGAQRARKATRWVVLTVTILGLLVGLARLALLQPGTARAAPSTGANVRVTVDTGSTYLSADQLAGGTYTDGVLARCGTDRRMQNEPTLAIDPRNTSVWTSGANDYCTVPNTGDAWAGFYRSTDGGV